MAIAFSMPWLLQYCEKFLERYYNGAGKHCREMIEAEKETIEDTSELSAKVEAAQISSYAVDLFANLVEGEVEEDNTDALYTVWFRFRNRREVKQGW